MGGFTTTGQVNNLTVQGITFTNTFFMRAGISNLILQYNTFENFSAYAVHGNPQSINVGPTINGVQVLHNQMDFVSDCVRGDGDENNWTISNNVCGPGIGQGGNVDDHYIQFGGVDGITIDNNAFEGPFNAGSLAASAHNNVIHLWGGQSNVDIENNIIWHTQSRAQTILIEEGQTNKVTIKNNLDVEDPSNFTNSNIYTMAWDINHVDGNNVAGQGSVIENNTADHPFWGSFNGVLFQSGDSASDNQQTVENNIVTPSAPGGNSNFNVSCTAGCTYANNVSGDGSAPGSGSTKNWTPNWQTTTWTPNNGEPWSPPPTGYYVPVGLTGVGYQGSIGPGNSGTVGVSAFSSSGGSTPLTGDLNNDGHVNIFDLSIFLSHWQQAGSSLPEDFNHDNTVNIFDLSILLSHYGS